MKTKKLLTGVAAAAVCVATFNPVTINAAGLSWKDGAQANYHFTYVDGDEGIESVEVADTNGTYKGEIGEGQTITTKTGTIVWRDSYTNKTTFTVDTKTGYKLVGLNGENVVTNDFKNSESGSDKYTFTFTDKGAEAWCFGKDVKFYLTTEKNVYSLKTEDGTVLTETKIGEIPVFSEEIFEEEGKHITGYTINGIHWEKGTPITEEMILNSKNDCLCIKPVYEVNRHTVTVQYFNGGMVSGTPTVVEKNCEYGQVLDKDSLQLSEDQYIVGDDDNSITVPDKDITINVVNRPTESELGYHDFSFTYTGEKDPHVQAVTVQWYGKGDPTPFDLNETAILNTKGQVKQIIKFFVLVDKGYVPTGELSEKEAQFELVNKFENNDLYQITFTRNTDHTIDNSPVCETFTIKTVEAK